MSHHHIVEFINIFENEPGYVYNVYEKHYM